MIMQEIFAHTPREDIYKVVRAIFVFTAVTEAVGALSLFIFWFQDYPALEALRLAIFHSVSAFCNAGFSLFKSNFMAYSGSPILNITICALIILGGIGFPVVYELQERLRTRSARQPRLSIHTKSVLIATALLILAGMVFFLWGELGNNLGSASAIERLWIAFFQSVTSRTAGFNTVDIGTLSNSTLAFMMYLMFWGASPGSCGGGVKTTTFAVLGAFTWSRLCRRSRVNMFKKSIPGETISRSFSLLVLSVSFIVIIFFLLLLTQPHFSTDGSSKGEFLEYLFETISAFGTVGLSMGVTAKLNSIGKLLIIIMMLVGRVGVLTFAYVIAGTEARGGIRYAEQNVMIG
jgi:trk system potassium uptake protein TrkH